MDKLKLEQYIRYFFSGAIVFPTLFFSYPQTFNLFLEKFKGINYSLTITALSLLIEIFIYSTIHRAIMSNIMDVILFKGIYGFKWWQFKTTWEKIKDVRYKRVLARAQENDLYEGTLNEWFARIHFMYCSYYLILLTLFFGNFLDSNKNNFSFKLFLFIGIFCAVCAIWEDYLAIKFDKKILEENIE
jgi:hypothetical protein